MVPVTDTICALQIMDAAGPHTEQSLGAKDSH